MDNKTEHFTLKEDGVIGWIENMPPYPLLSDNDDVMKDQDDLLFYDQALQSAISNAIKVRNQGEVKFALHSAFADSNGEWIYTHNTPYPLQCEVEKVQRTKIPRTYYALVTFPEPSAGVEETQEEIWKDLMNTYARCWDKGEDRQDQVILSELSKGFTITRKNK